MISINTNVASLEAQKNLNNTSIQLNRNIAHLSSGMRITSAADDAAGLAISTHLASQVRSYNQAQRNANDGISMIQVGEGALGEQANILQRLRELAVQSANGTWSSSDRSYLDNERSQLTSEIDRIANATNFNGSALLNAGTSGTTVTLQVGIFNVSANDQIGITFGDTTSSTLGISSASFNTATGAQAAIDSIDSAINTLSSTRSKLGASQNRLQSAVATLGTASVNTAGANSRILDVDVASETSQLTRNQILSQAGTAVLAQANQLPSAALSLLR